jgi:hypothetical protein
MEALWAADKRSTEAFMSRFLCYLSAGVICAALLPSLAIADSTVSTVNQGVDATYTAGNLDDFSAGTQGKVVVSGDALVFTTEKSIVTVPFKGVHNLELGALLQQKRRGLHFTKNNAPSRQQLTIYFSDGQTKLDRNITLEMDGEEAKLTAEQVEIKSGRRHRVANGDGWWGDSAWKTKRNGNAVKPEVIGKLPE